MKQSDTPVCDFIEDLFNAGLDTEKVLHYGEIFETALQKSSPLRTVTPKRASPKYVYALIDPRNAKAFYIGSTVNPERRLLDHIYDPASAARERCQEILAAGQKPIQAILSKFDDPNEADAFERALIAADENLLNRARPR